MRKIGIIVAIGAALLTASAGHAGKLPRARAASAAAASRDWRLLVVATPAGGFAMGNPNARVKLVEYGSMTCHFCRAFDAEGSGPLVDQYVKTGRVQYEFRNYVRDGDDLAAALIARCEGPSRFFPMTHALYAFQKDWVAKIMALPQDGEKARMDLPPQRQFIDIAQTTGLQQWATTHGLSPARSRRCLSDLTQINRLVAMNRYATSTYSFPGTPAFLINGKLVDGAAWPTLEPQLRAALGS